MKCFTAISVFFLFTGSSFAQHIYDCLPRCGYEHGLMQFLQSIPQPDHDRNAPCYFFYVIPNSCPRCEFQVYYLYQRIQSKNKFIVLGETNAATAELYIKENTTKGQFNYLVDSNKIIRKITTCVRSVNVPILMKIDKAKISFNFIQPLLGLAITDSFIHEINVKQEQILKCDSGVSILAKDDLISRNNFYTVEYPVNYPINNFVFSSITKKGDLLLIESGTNNILLINSYGKLTDTISASLEELMYQMMAIPKEDCDKLLGLGIPKVIYLSASLINDTSYSIIASVPEVRIGIDSFDNERTIRYFNLPVEITKSNQGKVLNIRELGFSRYGNDYQSLSHSNNYLINAKEGIRAISVLKGWPTVGSDEKELTIPLNNPFDPSFYKEAPLYAIIDSAGHLKEYLGKLPVLYEKYQTGYYYATQKINISNDTLLLYDKISGEISIFQMSQNAKGNNIRSNMLYHFNVFSEKMSINISKSSKYATKMDLLNSYEDAFFKNYIQNAQLINGQIFVMTRSASQLVFRRMSLEGKIQYEQKFGLSDPGAFKSGEFYVDHSGKLHFICLEERQGKYWRCTIDL